MEAVACVLRGDTTRVCRGRLEISGMAEPGQSPEEHRRCPSSPGPSSHRPGHCSWPSTSRQRTCFCAQVATAIPPQTTLLQWPPSWTPASPLASTHPAHSRELLEHNIKRSCGSLMTLQSNPKALLRPSRSRLVSSSHQPALEHTHFFLVSRSLVTLNDGAGIPLLLVNRIQPCSGLHPSPQDCVLQGWVLTG